MADEVVLSFHDCLVRKSDFELLEDGQWLNDTIIGFVFEYFEYILFNKLENVVFVNPDVAQYIKLCTGAELAIFLEPLNLHCKDTILIPVNNNVYPGATGGTHWSLLVYNADESIFQHYDSCILTNDSSARQMSESVSPFLRAEKKATFVQEACPQQENMYDCGMYLICIAEALCKRLLDKDKSTSLPVEVNAHTVKRKRSEIRQIIKDLQKTCPIQTSHNLCYLNY